MSGSELDMASDEVANDFWIFVQDVLRGRSEELPPEVLAGREARPRLLGAYLRNAFINHLRGQVRRKEISPLRHLYRRLRETLNNAPDFYYRAAPNMAYYSMEKSAQTHTARLALGAGSYRAWPSPCELVSERQLARFKGEDLCSLAARFWQEAAARLGGAYFLPIWELAAYLADHYGFLSAGEQRFREECQAEMAVSEPTATPETGGLAMLATQLVESWPPIRRKVFYLALDSSETTYRNIAELAGLSGASHAKYHIDRACQQLADFCETWPGVAPPPSDRNFWAEFLLITAGVCKNLTQERPSGLKGDQPQPKDGS
ncbi:hypothetical protein AAU61_05130 [Desulfocarbo indianensis]|nr:hypothetical protein AAU61_05130 [Desulfocarbo indianensis]